MFYIIIVSVYFVTVLGRNSYKASSLHLVELSTTEAFVQFVQIAKRGENELIVFPELALGANPEDGENITDVGSIPCFVADPSSQKKQYSISCAARENQIYVVLSLLEYSGDKMYNTAVVFDRTGKNIAKYRKTHILLTFLTPGDTGPTFFDTDFGERFGVFICADILFKTPAELYPTEKYGITNIVYPTFWVTAPPFYALQTQQSYSEFYQVNLISSNIIPYSLGTGHFSRGTALSWTMNRTSNQLLSSSFPIFPSQPLPRLPSIKTKWEGTDLRQTWFQISEIPESFNKSISTPYFSCSLSFEVTKRSYGQWFTFFAWRLGPPDNNDEHSNFFTRKISSSSSSSRGSLPPVKPLKIWEDTCGIFVCDEGNGTSLYQCFNNSRKASTYFENFELQMNVKDQVSSVRSILITDGAKLFNEDFGVQYNVYHNSAEQSIKSKGFNQPTLGITITALLDPFE